MATKHPADTNSYIRFGEVARERCGQQCQYAARNLAGEHGGTDLGSDLRWAGDTADYHDLLIHPDDADEFVRRYVEFRTKGTRSWRSDEPTTA